jgi:hypothetical protein
MLTASPRSFFGHTLVTPLTACWFGRAFFVIRSWPIRAIAAVVPCVVCTLSFAIDVCHITPPSHTIIALWAGMSRGIQLNKTEQI